MLRFAFPVDKAAVHASDLVPTFMNTYNDAYNLYYQVTKSKVEACAVAKRLISGSPSLYEKFQAYFASFAVHGNPNQMLMEDMPRWLPANGSLNELQGVMQITAGAHPLKLVNDKQNTKDSCSFWINLARSIEKTPTLVKQEASG
jgi:hypothetical protein